MTETEPPRPTETHRPRRLRWFIAYTAIFLWSVMWFQSGVHRQDIRSLQYWQARISPAEAHHPDDVWLPVWVMGTSQSWPESWVPTWPFMGLDFLYYYNVACLHHGGVDLYRGALAPSPITAPWSMSPIFFIIYGWSPWVAPRTGIVIWTVFLAAAAVVAIRLAWRARQVLKLTRLPFPLVLALALWSYPVLFEMERGENHLLIEIAIIATVAAFMRKNLLGDLLAGLCIAVIGILKYYPLIMILGLPFLRRGRAAVFSIVWLGLILLLTLNQEMHAVSNLRLVLSGIDLQLAWYSHSLTAWLLDNFPHMQHAWVVAVLMLAPLAAWVSLAVYRSQRTAQLAFPYLLWISSLGSFVPVSTMDYNLHLLVLAAVCVWDHRDRKLLQAGMCLTFLWWQPLGISGLMDSADFPARFLALKILSLITVGAIIVERAKNGVYSRAGMSSEAAQNHTPLQPAAASLIRAG